MTGNPTIISRLENLLVLRFSTKDCGTVNQMDTRSDRFADGNRQTKKDIFDAV